MKSEGIKGRYRGFTLVELMVVIAIIALLVTLALPPLHRVRERANQVRCLNNLYTVGQLLNRQFSDEYIPINFSFNLAKLQSNASPARDKGLAGAATDLADVLVPPAAANGPPEPPPPPPDPPPPEPPPSPVVTLKYKLGSLDYCPYADENPKYLLDPTNEPPYISYGILKYNLGRRMDDAWEWLLADAVVSEIESINDLAPHRHSGGVNVYFKDGSARWLCPDQIPFPEE